ncbi:hypothetical protein LTS18_013489 [Coniosporium uncinatum]|uniref:Uncharacterized protein n=1 Tax=Coniosporium uncinatum TaxID=93489 RepID=A0ACC3D918_9PEZI|nr:hypothetical protein LTS18_013489 [Coniosporium uncinatum]
MWVYVAIEEGADDEEFGEKEERRWLNFEDIVEVMSDLGETKDGIRPAYIQYNSIVDHELVPALSLHHQDNFLFNSSRTNLSIIHVTDGLLAKPWRGPLLSGVNGAKDVNLMDYKRIIDYLS